MRTSEDQAIELMEQALAEVEMEERMARWKKGDLIRLARRVVKPMVVYRAAARVMGRSARWAIELAKVAEAFPKEERLPDVDWYLYRLAANTEDPQATLEEALEEEWSPKELKAHLDQGKPERPAPPTDIRGEFMMKYNTRVVSLEPIGPLDRLELGEGTTEVPVKATIKSTGRKQ